MPDNGSTTEGSGRKPAGTSGVPPRVGDLAALARVMVRIDACDEPLLRRRKLVAEFCRLVGEQLVGQPAPPAPPPGGSGGSSTAPAAPSPSSRPRPPDAGPPARRRQ
jgi:hypothetical protein